VWGPETPAWGTLRRVGVRESEFFSSLLKPLYELKRTPAAGDWLLSEPEDVQTFASFAKSSPDRPLGGRRTFVVQPLGDLGPTQTKVVALVADYLERFLGLPVRVARPIASSAIPKAGRRIHPTLGVPQLHTEAAAALLRSRRPADAFAFLAFTNEDLYPDPEWNYVFGESFPDDRVGIWSLARYGNPDRSAEAFHLYLARAMKVAVHEATHLLGLDHCQAYECVMNGSNSLTETDGQSHLLCPICMQKLVWSTGVDPVKRLRALKEFFDANGFGAEAAFAQKNLDLMASAP
jgi:archaemetzincin